MGKILSTDELFTRINDQLSLCGACGVAVGDEDGHIDFHKAMMKIIEAHNEVATQQKAVSQVLVMAADLVFDLMLDISKMKGVSASELAQLSKEARSTLDQLKVTAGVDDLIGVGDQTS